METYLFGALLRAIGEVDESDVDILAYYSEGSYQGEARYAIANKDHTLFAEGSISWGSCSVCDPWHDMSEDEIDADLDRSVERWDSREEFVSYLTPIARLDVDELDWYERDAKFARKALNAIANKE